MYTKSDEIRFSNQYSVASSSDGDCEISALGSLNKVGSNSTKCTGETLVTKNTEVTFPSAVVTNSTEVRFPQPPGLNGAIMPKGHQAGLYFTLSPLSCDWLKESESSSKRSMWQTAAAVSKASSPLYNFMRDIEALLFSKVTVHQIEARQDSIDKRLDRINQHMVKQQKLLRSSRKDPSPKFSAALCQVAILNAEVECQRAQLELDKIEEEIKCTDEKIEGFYSMPSLESWDSN